MTYQIKNAADWSADLVIETDNATYVCLIDPTKAQRGNNAAPLEQQNCWQITRYTLEEGENGEQITRTKYPYGYKRYDYAPAECENYTYEYGF